MRWRRGRRSTNVEDRRGGAGGGRRMRMGRGVKTGGIGAIVLALVAMYFGVDPSVLMNSGLAGGSGGAVSSGEGPTQQTAAQQEQADFVSVVLADTEDTWTEIFRQSGQTYRLPKLVLFRGEVRSACGAAHSAMGPFYCPGDEKVYIDLSFYDELRSRHGAGGDFAQAYVIAHEVGHHIQTLLGVSKQVHAQRARVSKAQGNQLSVRQELQADCFAGIWANHAHRTRQILEQGDIEEAMRAASAIGDDALQRQARGYVTPDSFTHGTSEQRVRWFRIGLEAGNPSACDTFGATRI